MDNIYFLPRNNKPVKVIYEELPCPKLLNMGTKFRCKHAKSKLQDMNFVMYCSVEKCKHDIEIKIERKD